MSKGYDPQQYWDARLAARWDLSGVGHIGYSIRYNRWLYRAQQRALGRALLRAGAEISNKRILDIGSGTGYWLDWYRARGVASLTGVELSPVAVAKLRQEFPEAEIIEGDISRLNTNLSPFYLVNVMSVMYHVVDTTGFHQALGNLSRLTVPGGWLVLSDSLGARETQPAKHVRFRPLAAYAKHLPPLGFSIQVVEPVYTLLNGGLRRALPGVPSRFQSLVYAVEEALAPALYVLDSLPGTARWANMRLLVARKTPAHEGFDG